MNQDASNTNIASNGHGKIASPWNSLEKAKLVVAALTPLLILFYGHVLTSNREERAREIAIQDQLIKKRIELWDQLSPPLNDIYCYFLFRGHWKDLDVKATIESKRKADKLVYSYYPFFSADFLSKYRCFVQAAFNEFGGGHGKDAPLRTKPIRPKDRDYDKERFSGEENHKNIHSKYFDLLLYVSEEMNLGGKHKPQTPSTPASAAEISSYEN